MQKPSSSFLIRHYPLLLRIALIIALIGVVVFCGGLSYLLIARSRTVTLPEPTGPFPVGRTQFAWQEANQDPLAAGEPRPRELQVWVWYPAERAEKPVLYQPEDWIRAREKQAGLFAFLQQDLRNVHASATIDPPLAKDPKSFPVLVFEPGYGPVALDYTTLAEELASHGYIVAGVTPLESASFVVMPDGRVIERTPAGSLPENNGEALNTAGAKLVEVWSSDMRGALRHLDSLNRQAGMWAGRVDVSRAGFFGHSFGGAAAADACQVMTNCKAGADLDGTLFGQVLNERMDKPFMFMWSSSADQNARKLFDQNATQSQWKELPNTRHFNFLDQALMYSPVLKVSGMLGEANPAQTLIAIRSDLLAFFDAHVK